MKGPNLRKLSALLSLLALCVVSVGAYVRLSHAGLGCPDWPGCYGQLSPPEEIISALPQGAAAKAWKEMVHRYLAATLGLGILLLFLLSWRQGKGLKLPAAILGLVLLQALLGMWTVTLKVHPLVVTLHLAGGLLTLALLWWSTLRQDRVSLPSTLADLAWLRWTWGGLLLLVGQILLGGWTSANYAALACTGFPSCYGEVWLPETDFTAAFTLWRESGINYEMGVLESEARTAIHLSHRGGALLVLLYLGSLAILNYRNAPYPGQRQAAGLLLAALALQIGLGIGNVLTQLPLALAVAHNTGAALLLLALLTLLHSMRPTVTISSG